MCSNVNELECFFDDVVKKAFNQIKKEYESNYDIEISDKKNRVESIMSSGFIISVKFRNKKNNNEILSFEIENDASDYKCIKYTFHDYEFNIMLSNTFDKKRSDLNINDIYEKFKLLKN